MLFRSVYYSNETRWNDRFRSVLGVRADRYEFDVTSNLPENSGSADDSLLSPKMSLIYAVSDAAEVYLSAGRGFHSNDARGTTITIDPVTGDAADQVDPLVPVALEIEQFRSTGLELIHEFPPAVA